MICVLLLARITPLCSSIRADSIITNLGIFLLEIVCGRRQDIAWTGILVPRAGYKLPRAIRKRFHSRGGFIMTAEL